ncbi:MAG: hypothetical protein EPO63_07435 [Candidatus Nitrosotenuis sp.]|nr:MAG: hypothetical protein EPO63_07435 [Candidatus Nitrosotenuis sp.]
MWHQGHWHRCRLHWHRCRLHWHRCRLHWHRCRLHWHRCRLHWHCLLGQFLDPRHQIHLVIQCR